MWGPNPREQVRVGWQVPHNVTRPFLRLGDSPWNLGHKIPAEIRHLHSEVPKAIAPVDQYYVHAAIDDLLPGRTYFYAVGHDMEALYSPNGYGGQLARWDFPENGPAHSEGVYSFIYGNVGVISLDPNDV